MPADVAPLPAGIYCPVITFFDDSAAQALDLKLHEQHCEMLAAAGCHGVVVMGSTGEAVTLSREERKQLVRGAKAAVSRAALPNSPGLIIAGTVGAQSTQQAIELAVDAAAEGADYILVLPPSYYPGPMTNDALQGFFEDVADASPIPLIIYSYPAVSGGINMDTDLLGALARHPRIVGIKHTDHDVGKIARLAAQDFGSPFTVLGGATDYILGTLAYGGEGAITGMANVAPRVCVEIFNLYNAGKHAEALKYASVVSRAEWSLGRGGILGTKWAVTYANGYPEKSALARKPLPLCPETAKAYVRSECEGVLALEKELAKAAGVNGV